jgi:hypothetical protein
MSNSSDGKKGQKGNILYLEKELTFAVGACQTCLKFWSLKTGIAKDGARQSIRALSTSARPDVYIRQALLLWSRSSRGFGYFWKSFNFRVPARLR